MAINVFNPAVDIVTLSSGSEAKACLVFQFVCCLCVMISLCSAKEERALRRFRVRPSLKYSGSYLLQDLQRVDQDLLVRKMRTDVSLEIFLMMTSAIKLSNKLHHYGSVVAGQRSEAHWSLGKWSGHRPGPTIYVLLQICTISI